METYPAEQRRRVAAFVDGFSIEAAPREVFELAPIGDHLPAGTRVYLPAIGRADFAEVVVAATRLRRQAMEPVPHIAARAIAGAPMLDERLRRLRGEASVREVLVIARDRARPAGPYDSAMALLASGLLGAHSIERIGVGGHPEGSPNVTKRALAAALEQKNRYAQDSGAALYILTQFCFDARPIIAWERATRAAGNALPVHVGIAAAWPGSPPCSVTRAPAASAPRCGCPRPAKIWQGLRPGQRPSHPPFDIARGRVGRLTAQPLHGSA